MFIKPRSVLPVRKTILDSLSFKKIFLIWISFIIVFGAVYFSVGYISPGNGLSLIPMPLMDSFLNSLYFSFITATSTGYGDITPLGVSKTISVIEITGGMIMFGVLISKLVSYKQESILSEIYDISFEERVNRLRSALYLSRSDLDNIINRISDSKVPGGTAGRISSATSMMHETLIDVNKLICPQSKKEFAKRVSQFQLELIINSIRLSLNKLNDLIDQMNHLSYRWGTEKNRESVGGILSVVDDISQYHMPQKSKSLQKRINELESVKSDLRGKIPDSH